MLPGTTPIKIMCGHQLYHQGQTARPILDHFAYTLNAEPTKHAKRSLAINNLFSDQGPSRKCLLHDLENTMERAKD